MLLRMLWNKIPKNRGLQQSEIQSFGTTTITNPERESPSKLSLIQMKQLFLSLQNSIDETRRKNKKDLGERFLKVSTISSTPNPENLTGDPKHTWILDTDSFQKPHVISCGFFFFRILCYIQLALRSFSEEEALSSNGQDAAFSRLKSGFDSPQGHRVKRGSRRTSNVLQEPSPYMSQKSIAVKDVRRPHK